MKNWVEQCRDTSSYGYFGYTRLEGVLCRFHINHPILHQEIRFYSGAIGWTFPVVQTIRVSGTLARNPAFIPAGNLSPPVRNLYLLESDSGSTMLSRSFRYWSVPQQPPPLSQPKPKFRGSPRRNRNTATPRLHLYHNSHNQTLYMRPMGRGGLPISSGFPSAILFYSNLESGGADTTSCFWGAIDLPAAHALRCDT